MKPVPMGNYFEGGNSQADEDNPFHGSDIPFADLGTLPLDPLAGSKDTEGGEQRAPKDNSLLREGELVPDDFDGDTKSM